MKQQHFDFTAFYILSFYFQSSCMFMNGGGCKFTKLNLQYFYTLNYEKTHFWTSCETSTHYYDHLHNRILLTLFYLFIFSISKCTLTWIIKLNTFFFRNDGIGSFYSTFYLLCSMNHCIYLPICLTLPNWYENV